MNDVTKPLAAQLIEQEPGLSEAFDEFETLQQELVQLLDFMGVRHVVVEIPPTGNADATLHGNVSGTSR